MSDRDGILIKQIAERPSRHHGNTPQTRRDGISQMPLDRFKFTNLKDKRRIFTDGNDGRSIVVFIEIHHLDIDGRFSVQIS